MVARDVNREHAEHLSALERLACWVTGRVGTFGFFLIIATWTAIWLGWNTIAPKHWRFGPEPAFVLWLFISNMIQIMLMPLIMVGQNLQGRHSELRAEAEYQTTLQMEREIEDMQGHLHSLEATLARLEARWPQPAGGAPERP